MSHAIMKGRESEKQLPVSVLILIFHAEISGFFKKILHIAPQHSLLFLIQGNSYMFEKVLYLNHRAFILQGVLS